MKQWFKQRALIITLWVLLIAVFILGAIYFNHIKLGSSLLLASRRLLGGV